MLGSVPCARNTPNALIQRLPLVHFEIHGKRLFLTFKYKIFALVLLVHVDFI